MHINTPGSAQGEQIQIGDHTVDKTKPITTGLFPLGLGLHFRLITCCQSKINYCMNTSRNYRMNLVTGNL